MEISYTRYRIYRECPWKYKYLFVDGRRIPLNPKSSIGVSIHRALETYLAAKDDDLEALHEALKARWVSDGYPDEAAESRAFAKATRMLTRWHGEEEARRVRPVAIEREFIYSLGRHSARGMVDRIDQHPDGSYEMVDYKTGSRAPTPEELKADKQMRFYALGAKRAFGISPATITVDNVASGERVSVPCDFDEEALVGDIAAAADGIESARFDPDTRYCPRCDFRLECPYSVDRSPPRP